MTFTSEQNAALAAPLSRDVVAERTQSGRKLSYIEAWHAIAEANRIFGFDAWDRELVEMRLVAERERSVGTGQGWGVSYIAKVRVRVGDIIREGCGSGHGIDRDLGLAHESASKEAESDAMKRAFMTFGNPFGLALYDKTQANVADGEPEPPVRPSFPINGPHRNKTALDTAITAFCSHISALTTSDDLEAYVTEQHPTLAQYRAAYGRDSDHVAAITQQIANARARVASRAELPADAEPMQLDEPAHIWSESTTRLVGQVAARETTKALEAWVNLPATKALMATLDPVELQYVRGAYSDRAKAINAMDTVTA